MSPCQLTPKQESYARMVAGWRLQVGLSDAFNASSAQASMMHISMLGTAFILAQPRTLGFALHKSSYTRQ